MTVGLTIVTKQRQQTIIWRGIQALFCEPKDKVVINNGAEANNQVRLEEKKPCGRRLSRLLKPDFEVENSRASNFATSFKDGRENYETKMATARRDLAVTWV
jgi:hypothetical protein